MSTSILAVDRASIPYIRSIVRNLYACLNKVLPDGVKFVMIKRSLDELNVPAGTTIFVIGENLGKFSRIPGCTYIYLNFSVVLPLGQEGFMSDGGRALISRKMSLLREKLANVDGLLDYYPAQTVELQALDLPVPVYGFLPCVEPENPRPAGQRKFDVCFVGSMSNRRNRVLIDLKNRGLVVSPQRGADLEKIASHSKCTLNIHLEESNHLEIPRIIGSLSVGTPVVSEHSFGTDCFDGASAILWSPIDELADRIEGLLRDHGRLAKMQSAATADFRTFSKNARRLLEDSLARFGSDGILNNQPIGSTS